MQFRKERVKLHGKTNFEYRSLGRKRPDDVPRLEFLSTAREQKFDEVIAKRLAATIQNPLSQSQEFYKSAHKTIKQHPQISRPRFAHLEEKPKRKPVWVGDSSLIYTDVDGREQQKTHQYRQSSTTQKADLAQAKRDEHGQAIQETQLVGMEEYAKNTLEGKVDITKVKEIRRAIRRRYANRKNFQKIFTLWDEEGKGKVTVKNIYHMIKKLGLNMNLDEVRVLVASADEDYSGDLNLDEFMNLIFNDNEALNVDLGKLKTLNGEQEQQLLEGEDDQIQDVLREKMQAQIENRQINQVSLILKNKLSQLNNAFQELDPSKLGHVNFERFSEAIQKLQISEKIVNDEIIKKFYDKFKKDEYQIDYRNFLKNVKEFELQSQYVQKEEKKQKPVMTISLNPLQQEEKVHIFDCTKINSHHLNNLRQRATKMIKVLQRYLPEKNQFVEQILNPLKVQYINAPDLTNQLQQYLSNCGETIDTKDLGAFLSIIQYNNLQVPKDMVGFYIYEEGDDDFYERCSQKRKGPAPLNKAEELSIPPQDTQKSSFYDPGFGLSSLSNKFSPEMGQMLQKVEQCIFKASARQYDIFNSFDKDKDGYISHEDLKKKLQELHILSNNEEQLLIHYLDPEKKGSVNFQEFSSKLYPGMTLYDNKGCVGVVPSLYPAKERNENMKTKLPQITRSFEDTSQSMQQLKGATRFGATPQHKNTFLNVQRPPQDSALFLNEDGRFEKNARLRYLREDQEKEKNIYENKLNRIRKHQNEIQERIEQNYQLSIQKDNDKCKTKGLAAWSYEQRAHMQNEWK
ncbi:unnamed protein product [Paramecium primaurelia]|uniref:EF-hand domain-containing protein n=1 Tax=Paramecium primaurelia TaxID=5886 RepID=A0A8S1N0N1_PARPR|nr:unnamed protein product [Paramecium primaurelia]